MKIVLIVAVMTASCASAAASDRSSPSGEPVLDPPTLQCLGVYWVIRGDDNRNARVEVSYRAAGVQQWKQGWALFRVERQSQQPAKHEPSLRVPEDAWLFAGSIVMLTPDTEYEIRLKLIDPDGGDAEKTLKCRTLAEPVAPRGMRQVHVVPGAGGGNGSAGNPFRGLAAAENAAQPGDLILVHKGTYDALTVRRSGQPGRPIIWRGAGDGEAVIDAKGSGRGIDASGMNCVWFEKLTIRNADIGICLNEAAAVVIRRCLIRANSAIWCTVNNSGRVRNFFISDNVLEGPFEFPRDARGDNKLAEHRGIQITGTGHVVCYNRVRNFKDGIDLYPSKVCVAIDVHNNEVSECMDDGAEMDYSERNTRNFCNRYTNVFQGISEQPIFGGPCYVFRNLLYNILIEPFKLHSMPSGAIFFHNTIVREGDPLILWTPATVHNCVSRNNLFIGTAGRGKRAYDCDPPMVNCDFDYDGFGGGPWNAFLRWNGVTYRTIEDARARAPIYKHAVLVDALTVFVSGLKAPDSNKTRFDSKAIDLRLREGTAAIDAGEVLPGFNDGYAGRAPDLGAIEFGAPLPHYGPRPEAPAR